MDYAWTIPYVQYMASTKTRRKVENEHTRVKEQQRMPLEDDSRPHKQRRRKSEQSWSRRGSRCTKNLICRPLHICKPSSHNIRFKPIREELEPQISLIDQTFKKCYWISLLQPEEAHRALNTTPIAEASSKRKPRNSNKMRSK